MKQFYSINLLIRLFIALSIILSASIAAAKNLGEWVATDMSRTRLISATDGVGGGSDVVLGLHIELEKGWKTYWRNPGDSGLPPQFSWEGSDNIAAVEILWPKPRAFNSYGFLTWGYQDEVVFPIRVTVKDPGKPLTANLQVFYGICEEVCVPVSQQFSMQLPAGGALLSREAAIIEQFKARVPVAVAQGSPIEALLFSSVSSDKLLVEARSTELFIHPSLILEGQDGDFFTVTDMVLSENKKTAKFFVDADLARKDRPLAGRRLRATVLDTAIAAEGQATVK